ncbi:Uncharacterised protein [uncultured archaeon]|nr:Uncharacterised protein [uncultured archaeon]
MLSPAKIALTCHAFHLPPNVLGAAPMAVNVPSEFVVTGSRLAAPVPVNIIVFPPSPLPD